MAVWHLMWNMMAESSFNKTKFVNPVLAIAVAMNR